jgi:hypothetical protein
MMKKIIIGFSKPNKWKPFAELIKGMLNTNYDHVYIKFHSSSCDRDIIYQASKLMVNFVGVFVFESENIIIKEFEIDISNENYTKLMQFVIDNAGKPYSFKEIIGLTWVNINRLFGRRVENPYKEGNSAYVCSTIVGYIIENFTSQSILLDSQDMSPKDIYDLLEKEYNGIS